MKKKTKNEKNRKNVMKIILFVLGIVCMLYNIAVVSIIGITHWINLSFFIIGVFCILLGSVWKKLTKLNILIKIILAAAVAVVFVNFSIFEVKLISSYQTETNYSADYIILLGAKVNGQTPSVEYSRRITKAAEYLASHPDTFAVVSGGKGNDENISEAEAAKNALISKGIDQSRILVEDQSTSTKENMEFSAEIIKKNGGNINSDILIITSGFHLYRAKKLAYDTGYTNLSGLGCTGRKILIPFYCFREYAATVRGGF